MSAPAAWPAAALVAGVAIGALTGASLLSPLVTLIVCWGAASYALLRHRAVLLFAAAVAGAFCAGMVAGAHAQRRATQPSLLTWARAHAGAVVHLTAVLRDDAARSSYGVSMTVDVTEASAGGVAARVEGGMRLSVAGGLAQTRVSGWTAGRRVACDAVLREPLDYRDPGVPSERERLARAGVVLLGSVKSAALIDPPQKGGWIDEAAAAVRRRVRGSVADAVGRWSARSAGVVTAILIGDRSGLDPDDERRLQEAGTYHVIAISGGNIALLTMTLLIVARWCRVRPRAAAAASILLVAFYGDMAGLAPSVARATLAGIVFLGARTLDHRGPALNALAVAAALAAASTPLSVLDPGFVLSFGATVSIVLMADRLRLRRASRRDRTRGRAGRAGATLLSAGAGLGAATLCAEIALAPVGARLFGRVSAAGLLLNFAAIPLMSIVQTAGMAAVALTFLSRWLAGVAGWIAHAATVLLLDSARLVDLAPWLVRDVPPPAAWLVVVWYAAWAAAMVGRAFARKAAAACVAIASGTCMLAGPPAVRADQFPAAAKRWTRVVFLDVGQGDATLVWPSGEEPFLIDAGGVPGSTFDLGRRVMLPSLWALGVGRLSGLTLTHGDPDHIGGAPPLLRAFAPRAIWEGVPVPGHLPMRALHDAADRAGLPWRDVRRGQSFSTGPAAIRVLNPPEPDWERRKVRNDDSVVLDVRVGRVAFVLPGDISVAVEREVVDGYVPGAITVIKAPHHGSAGSSSEAFLAATHPTVVVFSAGQRNPFGHPAPVVVARYRDAGARIFRTDEDGAIVMDTDGRTVVVSTWTGRREVITAATSWVR